MGNRSSCIIIWWLVHSHWRWGLETAAAVLITEVTVGTALYAGHVGNGNAVGPWPVVALAGDTAVGSNISHNLYQRRLDVVGPFLDRTVFGVSAPGSVWPPRKLSLR